jgi:hypothetical protein
LATIIAKSNQLPSTASGTAAATVAELFAAQRILSAEIERELHDGTREKLADDLAALDACICCALANMYDRPQHFGDRPQLGEGQYGLSAWRCQGDLNTPILRPPLRRIVWSNWIAVAMPLCGDEFRLHTLGNQILHHGIGALL